jgi:TatD DNase family protein
MEFIDTHCHLHFESFDANRDDILQASQEAGVNRIICVGTTLADSRQAIDYAQKTAGVYAAAGVHPHEAKEYLKDESADSQLTALLRPDKVVAVFGGFLMSTQACRVWYIALARALNS